MKIAIVGSGIAGLVTAHHLRHDHNITVYEANDYVGGHANTETVNLDGHSYDVDTGFIVFNDWTYPNFIRLLDELNVPSQAAEMSFSVRDDALGLEYNGHSLNTLFAQRRNLLSPGFYRMVYDIIRFNRAAKTFHDESGQNQTVGKFLSQGKYSQRFRDHYLLPMGAAIWSCPTGVFAKFPIKFITEFYRNHGLLNIGDRPTWRVIQGGSKTYVSALSAGFKDRIRTGCGVQRITRTPDFVEVEANGSRSKFDHVVFACHSDQALKILGSAATPTECELLSKFPYSRNVALLHTDESLLPKRPLAWAAWNFRTGANESPACVTYNMSLLQQIKSPHTFCVTLNGESIVDPEKILRRYVYHHPVFTRERAAAQARHHELIDSNRSSFCGAYWRNGFHEDGVVSALRVIQKLAGKSERLDRHMECGSENKERTAEVLR